MKKTFFSILTVCLIVFQHANAQSTKFKIQPDKRLLQVYTEQQLLALEQTQVDKIGFLNYMLDHACYISDQAQGAVAEITMVSETKNPGNLFNEKVNFIGSPQFNYMLFNFKIDNNHYISYHLKSGKYLVFYPITELQSNYHQIKK